jgi:tetratricopeptide (TPR) repeat protein
MSPAKLPAILSPIIPAIIPAILPAIVIALIGLMVPAAAIGSEKDPRAEAKIEVERAALNYRLGRFEEALQSYARAYELFNAPVLLFNMGQCHKNLKHYERAIFFFQGYLREETNPEKRALAEELLAKSRADLEKQRQELVPSPAAAPDLAVMPPSEPLIALDVPPSNASGQPGSDAENATPLTRKWWFWTVLGAGAVAIAGGTIAYYATGHTTSVPPTGSAGILDRR